MTVKVGQRWTDNSPRAKGRIILVKRIYTNQWKENEPMAECTIIANPNNECTIGKTTRILVRRFQSTGSGYTLVSDVR